MDTENQTDPGIRLDMTRLDDDGAEYDPFRGHRRATPYDYERREQLRQERLNA